MPVFFFDSGMVQAETKPHERRSILFPSFILDRAHALEVGLVSSWRRGTDSTAEAEIEKAPSDWGLKSPVVSRTDTCGSSIWSWTGSDDSNGEGEIEQVSSNWNVNAYGSSVLMLIYVLYFLDAFVRANEMFKEAVVASEKERLLRKDNAKKRGLEPRLNPSYAFVSILLFYLAILPVGFYLRCWEFTITSLFCLGELEIQETIDPEVSHESDNLFRKTILYPGYAHFSLGYALLVQLFTNLSAEFSVALDEARTTLKRKLTRRLARFAIWNPRKFLRRFRKFRLVVRWVEYIVPINQHLLQSGLVSHVRDLVRKARQRGDARYNYICRRAVWLWLDDKSRQDLAAVIIQRNYRSYQSRKWVRLVRAEEEKKEEEKREEEIITLVQRAIKNKLTNPSDGLEESKKALEELHLLRQQGKQLERRLSAELNPALGIIGGLTRNFSVTVSAGTGGSKSENVQDDEGLKRKYEIQEEIKKRVKSEKEKLMLLRPDSRFSVSFKVLYVVCAIVEMSRLVLRNQFDQEADEKWGLLRVEMLRVFIRYSDTFISVVLCLGVFVSFFTGVLDPVSGRLTPKSFFSRWINQGIVLHLVVNPNMSEVSALVKKILKFVHEAGPGRVWRWCVMFLLPIWNYFVAWFEWKIWIRLVQKENQHRALTRHRSVENGTPVL